MTPHKNNPFFFIAFSVAILQAGFVSISASSEEFEGVIEIASVKDNLRGGKISSYGKLEIGFELKARIINPYDPADIKAEAVFTTPAKKQIIVPAFFFVPHVKEEGPGRTLFSKVTGDTWKVRFAPQQAGTWTYRITSSQAGKKAESDPVAFTVTTGKGKGFLRAKKESRYFHFDSGEVFLPIGSNVSWYDRRGMAAYETWFSKMAENGANYARIWMASWGFAQEWADTGLGYYGERQLQAAELDELFAIAEKYGIYLMLCLNNHGQFSTSTNPEWKGNPYNSANDGMCVKPADFLTNGRAKAYFKQRLRYIAARWGYSTNLFSWEWWNEVDLTDGLSNPELLVPWMAEMRAYLESVDPYGHLVSSSYSGSINGKEDAWKKGGLDYVQVHAYNQPDWANYMISVAPNILANAKVPLLFGEFGVNSENFLDPEGIQFHDGLFSGVFAGGAGTGMIWWWDTYIEPENLYYHYKGLSDFFKEDKAYLPETKPVIIADPWEDEAKLGAYALLGPKKSFIWVRSNYYYYGYLVDEALEVGIKNVKFPVIPKTRLTIPLRQKGAYKVEIWDPVKGKLVSREDKTGTDSIDVELPEFSRDLLLKVYR